MLGGRQVTTGLSGRRRGCRQDWLLSSSGFRLHRRAETQELYKKMLSAASEGERWGCWREDSLVCIAHNRK